MKIASAREQLRPILLHGIGACWSVPGAAQQTRPERQLIAFARNVVPENPGSVGFVAQKAGLAG